MQYTLIIVSPLFSLPNPIHLPSPLDPFLVFLHKQANLQETATKQVTIRQGNPAGERVPRTDNRVG